MSTQTPHQPALPLPLPEQSLDCLLLVMLRRMTRHGIRDARASLIAMNRFGTRFRKPLILLRCFIHEVAQSSRRTISIAPCSAHGMTRDEALLLDVLLKGDLASVAALTDDGESDRVLTTAHALQEELAPLIQAGR